MRITTVLLIFVLFAGSAQATAPGLLMLGDAAILHDEHRIKSLIAKEVQAEDHVDLKALNKAIFSLSAATDPLIRESR